jgi:hypothetical protein
MSRGRHTLDLHDLSRLDFVLSRDLFHAGCERNGAKNFDFRPDAAQAASKIRGKQKGEERARFTAVLRLRDPANKRFPSASVTALELQVLDPSLRGTRQS